MSLSRICLYLENESIPSFVQFISRKSYFRSLLWIRLGLPSFELDVANCSNLVDVFDGCASLPSLRWLEMNICPVNPKEIKEGKESFILDVFSKVKKPFPVLEALNIQIDPSFLESNIFGELMYDREYHRALFTSKVEFGDAFYSRFLEKTAYLTSFQSDFGGLGRNEKAIERNSQMLFKKSPFADIYEMDVSTEGLSPPYFVEVASKKELINFNHPMVSFLRITLREVDDNTLQMGMLFFVSFFRKGAHGMAHP